MFVLWPLLTPLGSFYANVQAGDIPLPWASIAGFADVLVVMLVVVLARPPAPARTSPAVAGSRLTDQFRQAPRARSRPARSGWSAAREGVVHGAMRGHREERVAAFRGQFGGRSDDDADLAHPGWPAAELVAHRHRQSLRRELVPGGVAAGVEGDTAGQACDEQLGRCRRGIGATRLDGLVDKHGMAAHVNGEPVAVQVPDSHLICHHVVPSHAVFGRPAKRSGNNPRRSGATDDRYPLRY